MGLKFTPDLTRRFFIARKQARKLGCSLNAGLNYTRRINCGAFWLSPVGSREVLQSFDSLDEAEELIDDLSV